MLPRWVFRYFLIACATSTDARRFPESNPYTGAPTRLSVAGWMVVKDKSEDLAWSAYGSLAVRRSWYLEFLAIEVQQILHVHPPTIV